MLKCIQKIMKRGKKRKHPYIDPGTHPWKVHGKLSPSRKELGTADYEAVRGDSVNAQQVKVSLRGKY